MFSLFKRRSPIGIVAKIHHPDAVALTENLISWLTEHKLDYRLDREVSEKAVHDPDKVLERAEITRLCNPIVVLGGDGTLISASRHVHDSAPTIIGVNLGTLGFLTEITVPELFTTLTAVLENTHPVEERFLLQAEVFINGKSSALYYAINDVVVSKEAIARIFGVELIVDRQPAAHLRGDGVIVCTAVGSTAYSLSAGGSIVHPKVDAMLITPICPHSLTSRPLVIPGQSEIQMLVHAAGNEQVFLTIDGQEGTTLNEGDYVLVKKSTRRVLFARSPSKSYYEVLGAKLKWAER